MAIAYKSKKIKQYNGGEDVVDTKKIMKGLVIGPQSGSDNSGTIALS